MKTKKTAIILAILVWWAWLHRFYLWNYIIWLLYIWVLALQNPLFNWLLFVIALGEAIYIAWTSKKEFNKKYNTIWNK